MVKYIYMCIDPYQYIALVVNNYAIYLTDITQSDSQMAYVPIDQNVMWKYFKIKPTCTIKDKNELILSENPINTSIEATSLCTVKLRL